MDNYRSISSLSIPGKCQEHVVYLAIYSHVSAYLSDWQHSFLKGRSTATQQILTHHKWAKALDEGHQVGLITSRCLGNEPTLLPKTQFFEGFDCLPHQVLLYKLCNFGISGNLLNLGNQRQRVVIDGSSSSLTEITSGVPQGSILRPLFFVSLLMIYLM